MQSTLSFSNIYQGKRQQKKKMHKSLPFLLLFQIFILTSSSLLSLSLEASEFSPLPNGELQGMKNDEQYDVMIGGKERRVLEEENESVNNNSTLILAAEQTHRRDPLEHFNYYTGGWDYRNSNYWASVSFSAAPLFVTAVVWFVLLGLFLCVACIWYCCCCCCPQRKSIGYSPIAYALSLIFLAFSTTAVIAGCIVLYINQENFSNSITDMLKFIIQKAVSVFDNLMNVMKSLAAVSEVTGGGQLPLPPDLAGQIDSVNQMINSTANIPEIQSLRNTKRIEGVLEPARTALNILATVMLSVAILGFLFSVVGVQCCIYVFVVMGWILVTLAFILCGIFLILHKNPFCQTSSVVADTCVAVDDWLQNPSANAPLSLQFLPCMDNETAQETLKATKQTSFYVINVVNKFIIESSNRDLPPDAGILYVNQSGPPVPLLCNPYYPDLTDRDCSHAEVNFGNVAQEWKKHVCEVSDEGLCITQGRLTPKICDQMIVAVNISYSLYSSGEFLVQLGDCSFVLKTFSEISENYCPDLRRYSFWTYVGLRIVATSVMCATVLWVVYSRERRIRIFTKELTEQNHFP